MVARAHTLLRLAFMAPKPKPHRLHQFAGAALEGTTSKKPRTMSTDAAVSSSSSSAMKDAFAAHVEYLNNLNEKRERIVKASRDVTMNSKKVIFQVHRMSKYNKEEVLDKAEKDLAAVRDQHVSRLVKELHGTDFWKLRRAYSPGEYIEAASFCKFCRSESLLNLDEINATLLPLGDDPSIEPLQINVLDYILGIADLTGELMRLAIGRISDGDLEFAQKICRFVREIYRELMLTVPHMDDSSDMKQKMDTMLQSVVKIENGMPLKFACLKLFPWIIIYCYQCLQIRKMIFVPYFASICHCLDPASQVPFCWELQASNYEREELQYRPTGAALQLHFAQRFHLEVS
ncbi:hypothetical protein Tsubulata_030473 [Turnera subulata]|uniref:Translin-associated protein X n=1 Tax=Turnera subulata TaxID=218843 RepID=A0A9Q0FVX7_9ROSI|nr:hypothetical protein Tsubulata_030473 [Turnera subulata]